MSGIWPFGLFRGRQIAGWAVAALLTQAISPISAQAAASPEVHCLAEVIQQTPDGEFITDAPRCYPTFAEAMLDASEGRLTLSANVPGSIVFTDQQMAATVSSFTLGIHYDGTNGTGSSVSVLGSSCSGGYWNTGTSWANRISSSYNGCYRLRHYDFPNKGGSFADTTGAGAVHNLPSSMDNKTESVAYYGS
jgi:hypothetical protein